MKLICLYARPPVWFKTPPVKPTVLGLRFSRWAWLFLAESSTLSFTCAWDGMVHVQYQSNPFSPQADSKYLPLPRTALMLQGLTFTRTCFTSFRFRFSCCNKQDQRPLELCHSSSRPLRPLSSACLSKPCSCTTSPQPNALAVAVPGGSSLGVRTWSGGSRDQSSKLGIARASKCR